MSTAEVSRRATRGPEQSNQIYGSLDKLVLQVAQFCNLRCGFCITQYGEWGKVHASRLMSPEMASTTVHAFATLFRPVAVINFFGGEPALNLPALDAAGAAVARLLDDGVLDEPPHLSMATNGTVAGDDFVRVVNRHSIRFAVSVDGPEELHDLQRVNISGRGSYRKIRENVVKLRECTGFPKGIALTYTVQHLRSPLRLWEMLQILREDFGISDFAVMPATNSPATSGQWDPLLEDPDRFIEEYVEAIERSLDELVARPDAITIQYGKNALASLVEAPHYDRCPAGWSYFSVSCDGTVFPCQNLPESMEYRISHVSAPTFAQDLRRSRIGRRIDSANRLALTVIGDNESRSMCRICPSDNIGETGSLEQYSPARFRLYQAIDQAAKRKFVELVNVDGPGAEQRRDRFIAHLNSVPADER
jgi:uncharacterized protein